MSKLYGTALICLSAVIFVAAIPTSRVVGGIDAFKGQFPHQVSVRVGNNHICGGSIISNNYILTAAHCIATPNPSDFSIRAGSTDRLKGGVVRTVASITVHEAYSGLTNDVALLKLTSPLSFSNNIQPIDLASAEVPTGEEIIISGWGLLKEKGDVLPVTLQWNTLKTISKTQCLTAIGQYKDSLICLAHEAQNGACNGDSGGPAVYNDELVGIAGFVVGGCGSKNPDGYTKVYYYVDWIKEHSV